jgi:hypothetical protein
MDKVERSRGPAANETGDRRPVRRSGVERSLEIQVGPIGGFELRPTRVFLWGGAERSGRERIVPLGSPPRSLRIPRREREIQAGAVHVRSLGNPFMTVALAAVHAARAVAREREPRPPST